MRVAEGTIPVKASLNVRGIRALSLRAAWCGAALVSLASCATPITDPESTAPPPGGVATITLNADRTTVTVPKGTPAVFVLTATRSANANGGMAMLITEPSVPLTATFVPQGLPPGQVTTTLTIAPTATEVDQGGYTFSVLPQSQGASATPLRLTVNVVPE